MAILPQIRVADEARAARRPQWILMKCSSRRHLVRRISHISLWIHNRPEVSYFCIHVWSEESELRLRFLSRFARRELSWACHLIPTWIIPFVPRFPDGGCIFIVHIYRLLNSYFFGWTLFLEPCLLHGFLTIEGRQFFGSVFARLRLPSLSQF